MNVLIPRPSTTFTTATGAQAAGAYPKHIEKVVARGKHNGPQIYINAT